MSKTFESLITLTQVSDGKQGEQGPAASSYLIELNQEEVLKNYKNESARANTFGISEDSHSELPDGISIINKSKTTEMADKEAEENEKSKRKENDLYDMYK